MNACALPVFEHSMDLLKIIRELYEERNKLDEVITRLEELQRAADEEPEKRRGRKFMDERARLEVSERMKKYWAERRKKRI
jgi:hypothetical protein